MGRGNVCTLGKYEGLYYIDNDHIHVYRDSEDMTDCIAAVNILANMDEDVDDWMIAGINAMLDKVNTSHAIPFDLPTSICGILCAQYR